LLSLPLQSGTIAFISQSGGNSADLPMHGGYRGLRFSKVVSYGNALDVDESELLEYFARDAETEIIAAYIEGIKDGTRFRKNLELASSRKPVVVYKGGTTEAGLRAAYGHTASLISSVAIFKALCRQLNAIMVEDVMEMIDVLTLLRFCRPLPVGLGVAVIGTGGGPSVLASDEIEKAGLRMPRLSYEVQTELRKILPLQGSIFSNPIDAVNLMSPDSVYRTMITVGKVPDVDVMIYHLGFHPVSRWAEGNISSKDYLESATNALKRAQKETGKPVLLALCPASEMVGMNNFFAAQEGFVSEGFPVFHSFSQAFKAIARVVAWRKCKEQK
jgi:acyl-CoA synthetase (NDP forming)